VVHDALPGLFVYGPELAVVSVRRAKEPIMVKSIHKTWPVIAMTVLMAAGALVKTAAAQKATPRPQDKLAIIESEFKQFLLSMDTDSHGKISKQEFMKFMEAEFDRLDKDKTGELDAKEIAQSILHPHSAVGK
jgi:hypothetical protein